MSEREYIFACILNELYKQTEYYNNQLPDFFSGSLTDFPRILHRAPPPARRPMVAGVLKKEEPEGDDYDVEERLEGQSWGQDAV